jgi:5-methylcytosine-specific restriction endonuclease McrA
MGKNKQPYGLLLQDKRWLSKRIEIIKRDCGKCTSCGSKSCLQVHHKRYIHNKKPWQYSNCDLTTLCSICHNEIHKTTKVKYYTYHKQKTKNKRAEMINSLSPEDKLLQEKYDKVLIKA